jgi:hypothetical protein
VGCALGVTEIDPWARLIIEIPMEVSNGVMDALDNQDAYYDDRANAQLIRAVIDMLGGPNAL